MFIRYNNLWDKLLTKWWDSAMLILSNSKEITFGILGSESLIHHKCRERRKNTSRKEGCRLAASTRSLRRTKLFAVSTYRHISASIEGSRAMN